MRRIDPKNGRIFQSIPYSPEKNPFRTEKSNFLSHELCYQYKKHGYLFCEIPKDLGQEVVFEYPELILNICQNLSECAEKSAISEEKRTSQLFDARCF